MDSVSTKSSKNELQEYCTSRNWDYPVYEVVSTQPEFTVLVKVTRSDQKEFTAEGTSTRKKCAEKEAASALLSILQDASPVCHKDIHMEETQGATPQFSQSASSIPPGCKNYRSRLSEYCQQHSLKPEYEQKECTDSSPPRFLMQLTVNGKSVFGSGNSKKEANEEAAHKMWDLLEEENSKPKKRYIPDHTTLQAEPFYVGLIKTNSDPAIPGLAKMDDKEWPDSSPLKPPVGKFTPVNPGSTHTGIIPTDHIEELEKMLKDKHSDMELSFVVIPTEGLTNENVFLFANIGVHGEKPAFAGHGKGTTLEEAKNTGALNLIELLPDEFTTNIS